MKHNLKIIIINFIFVIGLSCYALAGIDSVENNANISDKKFSNDIIKVYIVQSYEDNNVCGLPQGNGIINAFKAEFNEKLFIKTHYMNTKTINSTKDKMEIDAKQVLAEIDSLEPSIVFTIDDNAFREIGLKLIGKPFPVIFSGMNTQPEVYNQKKTFLDENGIPTANITGVYEKLHVQTSLGVIKAILPDTKKVIALLDSTPTGMAIAIQLKKELKNNMHGINTEIRHIKTMQEYINEIDKINNDDSVSAVYNVVLSLENEAGTHVDMRRIFKVFLTNSKKPALALNFAFCKMGLFGGASVDFAQMGSIAGKMGIKVLKGWNIKTLPIQEADNYLITFNLARAGMLKITIPDDIMGVAIIYNKMMVFE
ncbi:ABC transporter or sensor sytem substrate-binding protein [Candidatus Magnetomoraceae bacterium gMMP-15]